MGHEPGYAETKTTQINRLRRIEGQVRGLQRLVDEDEYCIDILTQVSAVSRALDAFAIGLLDEHLRTCVTQAIKGGHDASEKLDEASAAIARLVKSR